MKFIAELLKKSTFSKKLVMKHYYKKLDNQRFKSYKNQFNIFSKIEKKRFILNWNEKLPILNEKNSVTGFDRHYIYHTAWAIRKLEEINPDSHYDFSSSLYFSSLASANHRIIYHDFNKPNLQLDNLITQNADLTKLSDINDNSLRSVSCMHVVEHIGLGRYGDSLDYDGDLKAIGELKRVLAKEGNLLFVVPIGAIAKIIFNAHRIYTHNQILEYFSDFNLKEFTLIPENPNDGHLVTNPSKELLEKQNYACGCYWFKKI